MKNKILIAVSSLIIVGCLIAVIFIIKNKPQEEEFKIEGIEVNDDKTVLKDIKYDNLDIKNQLFMTRDGLSAYYAVIENNTDSDYKIDNLYVVFTINGEKVNAIALHDTTIKAKDRTNVNISFDKEISKVTKIEYSDHKNEEVNE